MYKAITTCRVSTKEQEENNSLSRQQKAVLAAAEKLGVEIPEDGQWSLSVSSKSGKNTQRKDLQEMIKYAKTHNDVKYLIVDEPDRFMRSIDEAFYYEVKFRELGVTVYYACDESLNSGNNTMTKMRKFMKYFEAEGSNEERSGKAIKGNTDVLLEGLWPFAPKFGYQRTLVKCLLSPIPDFSDFLRSLLSDVADGYLTPTQSLKKYNLSHYVKSGEYPKRRMDSWRKILLDPFYCGILSVDKQIHVYNENGRHEKLITKEQHLKIVQIVEGRKKAHTAPTQGGNPKYPMAAITHCAKCYAEDEAAGLDERHNRGKLKGYDHSNGQGKMYCRYSCRKCHRGVKRDDLHGQLQNIVEQLSLTPEALERVLIELRKIWENKKNNERRELEALRKDYIKLGEQKTNLLLSASKCDIEGLKVEYESEARKTIAQLEVMKEQIQQTEESLEKDEMDFLGAAVAITVTLANNLFNPKIISLEQFRTCEKLMFPGGFEIDENGKLHTPKISPFFRYKTEEEAKKNFNFSNVVHPGGFEPLAFSSGS